MTKEEKNKMILDMWSKEELANSWVNEHIKYNELKEHLECLQSKMEKTKKILNANTHVENIYHALCNLFDEEYQYEIDNEELNNILKGDE